jgi:lipopolysaccharide heptosyltransferase II
MPFRIPATTLLAINAQRICLIKPTALGDVVQTLPLLGMLRSRFPAASISWVVRRAFADILKGHPDLTEIIPFHRKGPWRDSLQLLKLLRHRRFDLVFDLQGLFRTAVMTWATGSAVRVGLETAREGASLSCNCVIPDSGPRSPAHLRYWRVAEALGMANHPRVAVIPTGPPESAWLTEQLRNLPRPLLAIHPGAGWETKRWPVEKFAEIARRFEGGVIVVGSTSERQLAVPIVDAARPRNRRVLNLAGETNLKQLAVLLGAADVVVSNDSGPMHIAAAMGTPVVGIFTCTSPILSGPAGSNHELISTAVPCAASYHKKCPLRGPSHLACLAEVPVDRVWNAVARVLDRRMPTARPA